MDGVRAARTFVVRCEAVSPIAQLLDDAERSLRMTAIVNDARTRLAPQIIAAIHAADGTPADLAIALARIIESAMRRAIKPELHAEFLQQVARVAEGMRTL